MIIIVEIVKNEWFFQLKNCVDVVIFYKQCY
jgi:hypothetical protein